MKKNCKKYDDMVNTLTNKLQKLDQNGQCEQTDESGGKYRSPSSDCGILEIQLKDAKNDLKHCEK